MNFIIFYDHIQIIDCFLLQLMSALPEDMQPGPDFLGVQWEAVIITLLVGMISIMILFWRTCLSVSLSTFSGLKS